MRPGVRVQVRRVEVVAVLDARVVDGEVQVEPVPQHVRIAFRARRLPVADEIDAEVVVDLRAVLEQILLLVGIRRPALGEAQRILGAVVRDAAEDVLLRPVRRRAVLRHAHLHRQQPRARLWDREGEASLHIVRSRQQPPEAVLELDAHRAAIGLRDALYLLADAELVAVHGELRQVGGLRVLHQFGLPVVDALRPLPERMADFHAGAGGHGLSLHLGVSRHFHVHLRRPEQGARHDAEQVVLVAERRLDLAQVAGERRQPHPFRPLVVVQHHLAVGAHVRRPHVPCALKQQLRRHVPLDPVRSRLVAIHRRILLSDPDEPGAGRQLFLDQRAVLLVHRPHEVAADDDHVEPALQLLLQRHVHVEVLVGAEAFDHRPRRRVLAEGQTHRPRFDVGPLLQLHDLARLVDGRDE